MQVLLACSFKWPNGEATEEESAAAAALARQVCSARQAARLRRSLAACSERTVAARNSRWRSSSTRIWTSVPDRTTHAAGSLSSLSLSATLCGRLAAGERYAPARPPAREERGGEERGGEHPGKGTSTLPRACVLCGAGANRSRRGRGETHGYREEGPVVASREPSVAGL